jgi:hypothetical protein
MDNARLPAYPEHREPTERIEGVEFEREANPRTAPWTVLWRGLAFLAIAFSAVAAYYAWEKYRNQPIKKDAAPSGPVKQGRGN